MNNIKIKKSISHQHLCINKDELLNYVYGSSEMLLNIIFILIIIDAVLIA